MTFNYGIPSAIIYDFVPDEDLIRVKNLVKVVLFALFAQACIYDVILQKQAERAAVQAGQRLVMSIVTEPMEEVEQTVGVAITDSDEGAP
jgi:hypothetical protein